MTALATPWSTRKADADFARGLRARRRDLAEHNPALARKLRRMSDRDLDQLEISLLELMPSSRDVSYELRALKDATSWRAVPRRKVSRPSSPAESRGRDFAPGRCQPAPAL